MARPPSEGSSGGSKKGHPRLRWLLPVGLIAVVILLLAGSIGKGNRPAPTTTNGLAAGVNGKIYTVTPSQTSVSSRTETPTVSATCSPTPTDIPTLTATSEFFFRVIVEPKHIYYRGTDCGEMQARFQVQVAEPAKVSGIWMFVRLINKEATEVTGWSGPLVMAAAGSGWYDFTLSAEDIPEYTKYRESRVLYRFVAYNSKFKNLAASGVHGDVELSACGK